MADSAASGDVLFQRGQNSDENEDIWDDTALIKAYDEAVSLMKAKVAEQNGFAESGNENTEGNKNQKKKKKKGKTKRKQKKWHVGDFCRAKFSEDGYIYEAEIISLDEGSGKCCVRYVGYGNEEEQDLQSLLPQHRKKKKESEAESDSGMEWKESSGWRSSDTKPRQSFTNAHPFPGWPGFPPETLMPPPTGFPTFPGSMAPPPSAFTSSRIPNIPPPPPPPMFADMPESDSEALCSMLMSWYMSGYHTGYYLGLQQGRKASGASSPFVNR